MPKLNSISVSGSRGEGGGNFSHTLQEKKSMTAQKGNRRERSCTFIDMCLPSRTTKSKTIIKKVEFYCICLLSFGQPHLFAMGNHVIFVSKVEFGIKRH